MSDLGKKLRQSREELGITLEEVSKKTNIKLNFLKLIENGDFCALPSFVHAKGFVKRYAEVLGIDIADIEELLNVECPRDSFPDFYKFPSEGAEKAIFGRKIKIILAVLLLLSFLLAVYIYSNRNFRDDSEKVPASMTEQKANSFKDNKTDETNAVVSSTFNSKSESVIDPVEIIKKDTEEYAEETLPPDKKVAFYFSDICWVHISVDNISEYDFIAEKGLVKYIPVKKHFTIDIGNAYALSIRYEEQKFDNFGKHKEPVKGMFFYFDDNGTLNFMKLKK